MRICPKCHAQINNPGSSFCFDCGSRIVLDTSTDKKVGEEVLNLKQELSSFSKHKESSADVKTKKWNSFILGANGAALLFTIFSVGVFFRTNFANSSKALDPFVSINSIEVAPDKLDIKLEDEVLKTNLFGIVPENAIFYAESSDLSEFLNNLLSSAQKKYIEDSYELKFSDFLIFMRPNYAFVRKNQDSWAVITKTGGVDFFERTYAKYQENKTKDASLITSRIGEFLVISNDTDFIQNMEDVNNKISLGLQNNANFSKSLSSVKGYAVFFAYSPSADFLANDLKKDLKLFGLENLVEHVGKVEGYGLYVAKDSTGYFVAQIN